MEDHHWAGQGWSSAVEPEKEEVNHLKTGESLISVRLMKRLEGDIFTLT
jgi:hypothetical protein